MSMDAGYRKPPLHSRFAPGQSGNPRGRPKGSRNVDTIVLQMLQQNDPQHVKRERRRDIFQACVGAKIDKAVSGDRRSVFEVVDLMLLHDNKPEPARGKAQRVRSVEEILEESRQWEMRLECEIRAEILKEIEAQNMMTVTSPTDDSQVDKPFNNKPESQADFYQSM